MSTESEVLEMDGSVLEGGGQILRNAAALSAITAQAITITNIRASRPKPGLGPQHLSGLVVIKDLCHGSLDGDKVRSTTVTLHPSTLEGGEFEADTKTAGSICLLAQAALPCMLFARKPSRIILKGGTNASMAPPIDYLIWVLKPMLERFGIHFDCNLKRRGFYPRGGGEVVLSTSPVSYIQPIDLTDRGQIVKVTGRAFSAGALPIKVAQIMADIARGVIKHHTPDLTVDIDVVKEQEQAAWGTGCAIILMAETTTGCRLAGNGLGERGVRAEDVGKHAAEELLHNLDHGGCVDDYLQDQLIIMMALAKGRSRIRSGPITLHTETAIHAAQLLTQAKFEIIKEMDGTTIIQCDGIGFHNPIGFDNPSQAQ